MGVRILARGIPKVLRSHTVMVRRRDRSGDRGRGVRIAIWVGVGVGVSGLS